MIRGWYFKTFEFNSSEAHQYINWPTFSHIFPFKAPNITEFRTTDTILHQHGHSQMDISKQNETHDVVLQLLQKIWGSLLSIWQHHQNVKLIRSVERLAAKKPFFLYHTIGKGMLNLTAKADKPLTVMDWPPQSPDLNVIEEVLDHLDTDVKDSLILKTNSQNCWRKTSLIFQIYQNLPLTYIQFSSDFLYTERTGLGPKCR